MSPRPAARLMLLVGLLAAMARAPAFAQTTSPPPATPPAPYSPVPPPLTKASSPLGHSHHWRRMRHEVSTTSEANAGSRSYPRSDEFVNATLYYDFEVGKLYEIQASPRFLTAIILRPGEKLIAKAAGDTVRWVLGETVQGAGAGQQVVVLVKPMRGGLRTNLVLTTDQRTYLIEAVSREGDTYTSAVSWNYPQEQMQALAAARIVDAASVVAQPALSVDQLHFGYVINTLHGKAPRWQPLRVFDDGLKTYIQFPVNMAATDAPPLFLVGPGDKAELVNYRYLNGYYVVDRLIDVAELRIGEKPQTIVRITRTRDPG